jgi:hypothetical protein
MTKYGRKGVFQQPAKVEGIGGRGLMKMNFFPSQLPMGAFAEGACFIF